MIHVQQWCLLFVAMVLNDYLSVLLECVDSLKRFGNFLAISSLLILSLSLVMF